MESLSRNYQRKTGEPEMINEVVKELSSAIQSNCRSINTVLELITKQGKQISELKKEIRELKSKIQ